MKLKKQSSILTIVAACLLAVVLIVSLSLFAKEPPAAAEVSGVADLSGNPLTAACISDIAGLNTLPFAMYSPNQFIKSGAKPDTAPTEEKIVFDGTPRSDKKGTYRFVVLNLDPNDANFDSQAAALPLT